MLKRKLLIVALTSVSVCAFATTQQTTQHKPIQKQTTAAVKSAQNSTPQQVKEEIAELKARLAKMNNNNGQPNAKWDWYKYVQISGLVNVDGSYYSKPYFGVGNRETKASTFLDLGTANLAATAHFGNWLSGRLSLLYMNGGSPAVKNADTYINAERNVRVDQAYITLANFARTPYFFRIGQAYAPFGRYQRYPMVQTLPQVISQTDAPIAQLGFVTDNGFYGSAYAMNGEKKYNHNNRHSINNGGFTLGVKKDIQQMAFDIGMSYMINMGDVDNIRNIINNNGGYRQQVGGVGAYLDVFAGPFKMGIQEVMASKRFNVAEYAYTQSNGTKVGAKPSAGDLNAEYSFLTLGHHSQVLVSYQWSSEAHNTASGVALTDPTLLPRQRISAMYGVNLMKHLAAYALLYRDYDYTNKHGGTNQQDNVAMLRLSLMM